MKKLILIGILAVSLFGFDKSTFALPSCNIFKQSCSIPCWPLLQNKLVSFAPHKSYIPCPPIFNAVDVSGGCALEYEYDWTLDCSSCIGTAGDRVDASCV